jgi:DNA-binding PadR family transcriptional regulator
LLRAGLIEKTPGSVGKGVRAFYRLTPRGAMELRDLQA